MPQRDLDRIRLVTGHFRELQGLRRLPLWLGFALLGCAHLFHSASFDVAALMVLLPSLVLISRIDRYYRERFGEVERQRVEHPRSDYLAIVGLALLVLLLFLLSPPYVFGRFWYAFTGTLLLAQWLWTGRHPAQGYKALLGTFALGLTVASAHAFPFLARDGVAEIAGGLLWTLSCLLDHRQLVLAMRLARPAEKSAPATEGEP